MFHLVLLGLFPPLLFVPFIRLVCNGLKRWRKHETSRIKETKNVVKGVVNGVCWVKKKERRAFISFLCPFLFSSATTQHTTEQSRPVKGSLFLLCLTEWKRNTMDWTEWGKRDSFSFVKTQQQQRGKRAKERSGMKREACTSLTFFSSFPSSFVLFHHSSFLSFIRFYFNGM